MSKTELSGVRNRSFVNIGWVPQNPTKKKVLYFTKLANLRFANFKRKGEYSHKEGNLGVPP